MVIKFLDRAENVFVVIAFFLATLLVFVNVIFRFFGYGTTWSEELIRYLLIWLTFIGASICVRNSEHVGIDVLPEFLPDFLKKILAIVTYIIAIIFLGFIVKYSVELIQFNVERGQITPALGIPMYLIYLCVPIGSVLMMIRYIVLTFTAVTNFKEWKTIN